MDQPVLVEHDGTAAHVKFMYLDGGYMVYQCLRTDDRFRSSNYKMNTFTASNGITISSKNSPVLTDPMHVYVQGAYPGFSLKPSVLYVDHVHGFMDVANRICEALGELGDEIRAGRTKFRGAA